MNNPFDNHSGHHHDSSLDDLMSQLGVDAHQHNQPTDLLSSDHTDPYNQPADLLHGGHVDSLNSNIGSLDGSQMQNLHHSGWVDLPHQAPGIDHGSTGYNQQLPDTYHHELPSQWQDPVGSPHHYDAGNGLNHHNSSHSVLNSSYSYASSSNSYEGPRIDIDGHGHVYLHGLNGKTEEVGHVSGRDFYNSANWHVGYLGKDGHIYDRHGKSVGTIEAGHVYRQNGKEVARADTDLEGAAHMLFAVLGGTR